MDNQEINLNLDINSDNVEVEGYENTESLFDMLNTNYNAYGKGLKSNKDKEENKGLELINKGKEQVLNEDKEIKEDIISNSFVFDGDFENLEKFVLNHDKDALLLTDEDGVIYIKESAFVYSKVIVNIGDTVVFNKREFNTVGKLDK